MESVNRILKKVLPRPISIALLSTRDAIRRSINQRRFAGGEYYCCLCEENFSQFIVKSGIADCPMCDSSERHRVDWSFLKNYTNLFDSTPKKMLHVAPELFLAGMFKKIKGIDYLSADLQDPRAMIKMDLTDIDLPDNLFDVIYCSHVLEHIIEDRKAMRELYIITKSGGWALLQVPINTDVTFEDASITSDQDRIRVFPPCQYR